MGCAFRPDQGRGEERRKRVKLLISAVDLRYDIYVDTDGQTGERCHTGVTSA